MLTIGTGGVAAITGAASGIGLGIARAAAKRGMKVTITDIDAERLATATTALQAEGGDVTARVVDVTDPGVVDLLSDQ